MSTETIIKVDPAAFEIYDTEQPKRLRSTATVACGVCGTVVSKYNLAQHKRSKKCAQLKVETRYEKYMAVLDRIDEMIGRATTAGNKRAINVLNGFKKIIETT